MDFLNLSGTESDSGNRHCPSFAICPARRFPLASSTMVQVGSVNRGLGIQKTNQVNNAISKMTPTCISLDLLNLNQFTRIFDREENLIACTHCASCLYDLYPLSCLPGVDLIIIHCLAIYSRQIKPS